MPRVAARRSQAVMCAAQLAFSFATAPSPPPREPPAVHATSSLHEEAALPQRAEVKRKRSHSRSGNDPVSLAVLNSKRMPDDGIPGCEASFKADAAIRKLERTAAVWAAIVELAAEIERAEAAGVVRLAERRAMG